MYIVIAILIFGVLITVHELGHFLAAKSMGIKVNEFSIGMGPAIFKKKGKETSYSLRVLPIGGFCAIEGEDGNGSDERSMANKPLWSKVIVLFAGAFMNFLLGLIILIILLSTSSYYSTLRIEGFMEGFPLEGESGLMAGDRIVSVNGHSVALLNEFSVYMERGSSEGADLVIIRDGNKLQLNDFPLRLREYTENGVTVTKYGLYFSLEKKTFFGVIRQGFYQARYFVRLVWLGLQELITGKVGLTEMSGTVGVVAAISEVGASSASVLEGILNVLYFGAFIAINLAVMNLLPIPGLDGGHIFTMIVSSIIALIIGHKPNPKIESYIHAAGLVCLLGLMAVLTVSDIYKLF